MSKQSSYFKEIFYSIDSQLNYKKFKPTAELTVKELKNFVERELGKFKIIFSLLGLKRIQDLRADEQYNSWDVVENDETLQVLENAVKNFESQVQLFGIEKLGWSKSIKWEFITGHNTQRDLALKEAQKDQDPVEAKLKQEKVLLHQNLKLIIKKISSLDLRDNKISAAEFDEYLQELFIYYDVENLLGAEKKRDWYGTYYKQGGKKFVKEVQRCELSVLKEILIPILAPTRDDSIYCIDCGVGHPYALSTINIYSNPSLLWAIKSKNKSLKRKSQLQEIFITDITRTEYFHITKIRLNLLSLPIKVVSLLDKDFLENLGSFRANIRANNRKISEIHFEIISPETDETVLGSKRQEENYSKIIKLWIKKLTDQKHYEIDKHSRYVFRIACTEPLNNVLVKFIQLITKENDWLETVVSASQIHHGPDGKKAESLYLIVNLNKPTTKKHKYLFAYVGREEMDFEKFDKEHIRSLLSACRGTRPKPSRTTYIAGLEEILFNSYRLAPLLYCSENVKDSMHVVQKMGGLCLSEVCNFTLWDKNEISNTNHRQKKPFIQSDIFKKGHTDIYLDVEKIKRSTSSWGKNSLVESQSVLVGRDFRLNPRIFNPQKKESIVIDKTICAIGIKEKWKKRIDIEYLAYQLDSRYFLNQVLFNIRYLLPDVALTKEYYGKLLFPLPPLKEQKEYVANQKNARLKDLALGNKELIDKLKNAETQEKEEAQLNIIQHIAHNLNPKFTELEVIIKRVMKVLEGTSFEEAPLFSDPTRKETLKDGLIEARRLKSIMFAALNETEKFLSRQLKQEDFTSENIIQLFKKEIFPSFNALGIEFHLDGAFKNTDDNQTILKIHKASFVDAMENLIRNALKHGHNQLPDKKLPKNKSKNIEIGFKLDRNEQTSNISIHFWNNGKPLPFTLKEAKKLGNKQTDSDGQGIGLSQIDQMIKAHNAKWDDKSENSPHNVHFIFNFDIDKETGI